MAITRSNSVLDVALDAGRTIFQQKRDQMHAIYARRKVYRDTYRELSALPDRALQDLGIARCHIRRLALETAHDS